MRVRGYMLGLGVTLLACTQAAQPRAQWKVSLSTDAPVPALGQQVFVEIFEGETDAGATESRLFDGSRPVVWPLSFGVVPKTPGAVVRVRARLYRLEDVGPDGLPEGDALIDAVATLPPIPSGIVTVSLPLWTACFGVPADLAAGESCDPAAGALAPEPTLATGSDAAATPTPGSWAPAAAVPCPSAPSAGMTCVPGGAFLMGAAQVFVLSAAAAPSPEHLVELPPFAIDTDEVTVGTIRSLVNTRSFSPPTLQNPDPTQSSNFCTYLGAADASNDAMPANCVSWTQANEACALLGKRLPTEAEWEYIAGNQALKTTFPWTDDGDACTNAIVAHDADVQIPGLDYYCLSGEGGFVSGPVAGGSSLDVTALGVLNLGGNMTELVADVLAPYDAPCWTGHAPLLSPRCDKGADGATIHVSRGGSWMSIPSAAHSYARGGAMNDEGLPSDDGGVATGFRCAHSF